MNIAMLREPSRTSGGWPKALVTMAMVAALLASVEIVAQIRSHLKIGESVLTWLQNGSAYALDASTGLKLLRPNQVSGGTRQSLQSNPYGLRSPDIDMLKTEGALRIAVLGASTVMGAYAANNQVTFPSLLQQELRERTAHPAIEVINAGIAGSTLPEQTVLFERLIARFDPDVVIVYPGFNHFAGYCRPEQDQQRSVPKHLVDISLPAWLLSIDLLLKNTTWMRQASHRASQLVDAGKLDITPYKRDLAQLFAVLRQQHRRVLMATNARSYRREQPLELQFELSQSARYYNPCFDIDGLHTLYDRHNAAIIEVAEDWGVPVLRVDQIMAGGRELFVDSSHFSERGNRLVAASIAEHLLSAKLAPQIHPLTLSPAHPRPRTRSGERGDS